MTLKLPLLVLLTIASISLFAIWNQNQNSLSEYSNWKQNYNIKFDTTLEDIYRQKIFMKNIQKINRHNANTKRTYDMGVNQFSALSQEQFIAFYLNQIDIDRLKTGNYRNFQEIVQIDDVDWVSKGAVTPVKTQGQCAASWAFSATGSLEALSKIAYGTLRSFSDQQLLDCTNSLCTCQGGFTDMAIRYVESHGLCEQSQYPYEQAKHTCKPTQCTFKVSDYDYVDNCNGLGKLIAQRPISVAVQATNWQNYKSGVFSDCTTKMNSMALLVGVVQGNWKVKNSWGAAWGENGYIRVAAGNTCGICSIGIYPLK